MKLLYLAWLRRQRQFGVLHFLSQIWNLTMTPIFGKGKFWGGKSGRVKINFHEWNIFVETWRGVVFTDTLWVKTIAKITLSHTTFEIQAFLCFQILAKNSKIQNGHHFWRDKFFSENWISYSPELPCGSKFRQNRSNTVFKIQTFLCFAFWKKNLKIQNGRQFWWVKYLLKLGKASLHRYPVGQNFCQNHYLIFEIQDFVKNAKNPKWPPFLAGQNFCF